MFIYDRLSINLLADEITPQIEAVQNDTGRGLLIDINASFENPQAFAYVDKADGHKVFNNCSISGSIITVEFSQQMLAAIGMNYLQIMIMDNSQRVTSFDIPVLVKKSRVDNSAIESTDEWGALEQLITQAQTAIDGATTAAGTATEAANNANAATEAANIAAANAETKAQAANAAANNAQQQADRASAAASGANIAADNAETAADNAETAAVNANNAVAGLATQKRTYTNIQGLSNVTAQDCCIAKTGKVVEMAISANITNAVSENWISLQGIATILNALPNDWKKFLTTKIIGLIIIEDNGVEKFSPLHISYTNGAVDNVYGYIQGGVSANSAIFIDCNWIVDN